MKIRELTDEEVVIKYKNLVYKISWKMFKKHRDIIDTNMLEVEDFFQIGYMALINAKNTYKEDSGASFMTYASTCIINRLKAIYLRTKQVKTYMLLGNTSLDYQISEKDRDELTMKDIIGIDYDMTDRLEIVELLEKLPGRQQEILVKYYIEGYNMEEIGKIYNCSRSYISAEMKRIKKKLKKELDVAI